MFMGIEYGLQARVGMRRANGVSLSPSLWPPLLPPLLLSLGVFFRCASHLLVWAAAICVMHPSIWSGSAQVSLVISGVVNVS